MSNYVIEELRKIAAAQTQEIDDLRKQNASLEEKIDNVNSELALLQSEQDLLQQSYDKLIKDNDELDSQLLEYESHAAELANLKPAIEEAAPALARIDCCPVCNHTRYAAPPHAAYCEVGLLLRAVDS